MIYISTLLFISSLAVINGKFQYENKQYCLDCVPYTYCKMAKDLFYDRRTLIRNLYQQTTCGKHLNKPLVCCSQFERLAVMITTSTDTKYVGFLKELNKEHPKLRLLPKVCGYVEAMSRIAGGHIAELYEFPWMVLLAYEISGLLLFQCSGTIISSKYILTAAHCTAHRNTSFVRIGDYDLRYDEDCEGLFCESYQNREVDKVIVHPNYKSSPNYINDIALLRLDYPIDMSRRNVQAVCLPTTRRLQDKCISNRLGIVTGWGLTEFNEESTLLLKVALPIRPQMFCQEFYRKIKSTQFCAGTFMKDSCRGDSGGPLVLEEYYKGSWKYIQYGIVSTGPANCGSKMPGIYTDVRKYVTWILDNLEE